MHANEELVKFTSTLFACRIQVGTLNRIEASTPGPAITELSELSADGKQPFIGVSLKKNSKIWKPWWHHSVKDREPTYTIVDTRVPQGYHKLLSPMSVSL